MGRGMCAAWGPSHVEPNLEGLPGCYLVRKANCQEMEKQNQDAP